jgi:hypothetical protein
MEHIYINPDDIRKYWGFVKDGLLKIQEKSPESWIPEDVYALCLNQQAMLWIYKQDNRLVGFSVLQPNQGTLHIWCLYFINNYPFLEAWNHIQELAKNGGDSFITFDSHRKGWSKTARKLGFTPRKWIKEL